MRKIPLFFNFLVEFSAALLLFFAPQFFHAQLTPDTIELSRSLGVGALVIALLTLRIAFSSNNELIRLGLWVVVLYHFGISIVQLLHPMPGVNPLFPPMFHGSIALWALATLSSLRKWY